MAGRRVHRCDFRAVVFGYRRAGNAGVHAAGLVGEFVIANDCDSLADLRNRMIAEGIELIAEAVAVLERGSIAAVPQADREQDHQFFVMHERLKTIAARRLQERDLKPVDGKVDGGNDKLGGNDG